MKQLVYRSILGSNPRKHEVSIEEISDKIKSRVSRKIITKFFVKDFYRSQNIRDLKNWIRFNQEVDCKKHSHVFVMINSRTKEYNILCKVLGAFFVIWGLTAFKVVYVNQVKVSMANGIKR